MKRFFGLLLLPSLAFSAGDPCALSTAQDVLACALQNHPDRVRAEAEWRASSALQGQARQIPNPEVSAESTFFSEADQPATKIEATYLHTFELGGKRSARLGDAAARENAARARLRQTNERIASGTVLKLYRLRQLSDEIRLVDEAISTFKHIVSSYKSRPRRSGEQDISLGVFRMAQADYEFRKSVLLQERAELDAYFRLTVERPFSELVSLAPAARDEWPVISSTYSLQTGRLQEIQAGVASAEAGLSGARGDAWPDLQLGPRLESETGHNQNAQGYGAALSLGLPLYHRNTGAKRAAQASLEQTRIELEQTKREVSAEHAKWEAIYQEAVRSYKEAPALAEIEKHHSESEKFFERGMITPSLIIEAHRQMVDLAKSRHEQERRALEALWQLYALEGRAMEERL